MISKIEAHEYKLCPKAPLNALDLGLRHGALLKFSFEEGLVGYGDLFPWEELGDEPLAVQLKKQSSPQFFQSMHYARLDALARKRGESLFRDLKIPKSHNYLKGLVKKKMGRHLKEEIAYLKDHPENTWRLDFNETLSLKTFEEILPEFKGLKVDFFEDPFPFDPKTWERLTLKGVPLAVDRSVLQALKAPQSVSVFVVKPALHSPSAFMSLRKRVVITSYMDHPVGQLFAAFEAARTKGFAERPGLLTHTLYEENPFSRLLKSEDDVLIPPQGTGIGFDTLLETIEWKSL